MTEPERDGGGMKDDALATQYDVVVAGSGSGGMLAAIRAHDLGLSAIVIEKSDLFGGTTAMSGGGQWVPCNHLMENADDRETSISYMLDATGGSVSRHLLESYFDISRKMLLYLCDIGVSIRTIKNSPDYLSNCKGSVGGRGTVPAPLDAALLGNELSRLRMPHPMWQLLGRYSLDQDDLGLLLLRLPGWKRRVAKIIFDYWKDIGWRLKTRRDRKLTFGNALVASLRLQMMKRNIPIVYGLTLTRLIYEAGEVRGAVFARDGKEITLRPREAVVLATGGFEHDPDRRNRHMPFPNSPARSFTPGNNDGAAITAAEAAGAASEFMDGGLWVVAMQLPSSTGLKADDYHGVFRSPHSLCVNRLGERFTDESASHDAVGLAMIEDYKKNGANIPCWFIFDSQFRKKYIAGGIMPADMMPDSRIPKSWWDNYLYRGDTIGQLAAKIGLEPIKLEKTVSRFNNFAANGLDEDFGRGSTVYDRAEGGDPRIVPNPCLAPLNAAPYYAFRLHLCDIGTKGGIKVDEAGAALTAGGDRIPGLFATGAAAASLFGMVYPGPGTSIGPSNTRAYAAATEIARLRQMKG